MSKLLHKKWKFILHFLKYFLKFLEFEKIKTFHFLKFLNNFFKKKNNKVTSNFIYKNSYIYFIYKKKCCF